MHGFSTHSLLPFILLVGCLMRMDVVGDDAAFFYVSAQQPDKGANWYTEEKRLAQKRFPPHTLDSLTSHYDVNFGQSPDTAIPHPFADIMEKCVYEVRWLFMSAGYGILGMEPGTRPGTITLSGTAVTHKFLGALYHVEDYITSFVDSAGLFPYFFEEHIHEGGYRATRWKLYDHYKENVYAQKEKKASDSVPRFVHNYLSAFYYFRGHRLHPGDTVYMHSFVQGKTYRIYFACIRRETISLDDTTFSCVLVRPHLRGKAMVFREKDRIDIWVTDDRFHTPVLVKAKIIFGNITCRLLYAKRRRIGQ